jgi:putative transcriptional regulator
VDELRERIAGEITLSDSPGSAMKKWRELFNVTQIELAKQIKISASTISDYESNRRLSPGVSVIKRFVDALFFIDNEHGSPTRIGLERLSPKVDEKTPFYTIHDFSAPISGTDFNRIIEGRVLASPTYLDSVKLFGYTRLDSLRVILEMSPSEYPKLFGSTTERAFVFERVSTGRSPLVVVRVAPIKPKLIVIHNVTTVDKLAIKIAQVERIPLLTTKLDADEMYKRLNKL